MDTNHDIAFADVPEGHAAIAEMSGSGDTKYVWDPKNPDEVEAAREHFEKMKAKGFVIFKLKAWVKVKQVDEFDPKDKRYAYVVPKGGLPKGEPVAAGGETEVAKEFDPNADRYVAVPMLTGG